MIFPRPHSESVAEKYNWQSPIVKRTEKGRPGRQSGIWDTLLQCLQPGQMSLWATKYKETIRDICMPVQVRQIMDKIPKDQKPNCHCWGVQNKSRVFRAKAEYCACTLHTASPSRWADHPDHRSHFSSPTPPSSHIRTQIAPSSPPPPGRELRNLLLVFYPSYCSRSPNKTLPEFPVWLLINFYWLRNPRTLMGNTRSWLSIKVFSLWKVLSIYDHQKSEHSWTHRREKSCAIYAP